jgi:hypothetical protein
LVTRRAINLKPNMLHSLIPPPLLHQSTGETRVQSPLLKTKVNVEHAGHSLPLVQWKELIKLKPGNSYLSQNSNWLIAQA